MKAILYVFLNKDHLKCNHKNNNINDNSDKNNKIADVVIEMKRSIT